MSVTKENICQPIRRQTDTTQRRNVGGWHHNFVLREADLLAIERAINLRAAGNSDNQQRDSRAQRTDPK